MRLPMPAAPAFSAIDRLRTDHTSLLTQAVGVAVFTLLTVFGAQVRIPLFEVPFTLQTLAVYGAGLFLGARAGALSSVLYLALGLFLPVFAGADYGAGYLFGATGGYLVALPLVALVVGQGTAQRRTWLGSVAACLASLAAALRPRPDVAQAHHRAAVGHGRRARPLSVRALRPRQDRRRHARLRGRPAARVRQYRA